MVTSNTMTTPINNTTLETLPAPVREQVKRWKARHNKRFFYLYNTDNFWTEEGGRYTAYILNTGEIKSAEAANGISGGLGIGIQWTIPHGDYVVEEVISLGVPMLNIFFNPPVTLATGAVSNNNLPALKG